MPWYMDRHDGVDADPYELAEVHGRDLAVQSKYNARYVTGWFDQELARYFCLVEAPTKQAAVAVHREAHDAVANEIIEVNLPVLEQFLGSVEDTPFAKDPRTTAAQPPALRVIMFTDIESSTATTQRLGDDQAMTLLHTHNELVRNALNAHSGREVKHTGDGIMASFLSASGALTAAIDIQKALAVHEEQHPNEPLRVRIGLSAGEPVLDHEDLFGAAVNLARRMCDQATPCQILVPEAVRQLALGKGFRFSELDEVVLKGFDEPVRLYAVAWQEH
jgi:class 3 adenylate cyclase